MSWDWGVKNLFTWKGPAKERARENLWRLAVSPGTPKEKTRGVVC